MENKTEQTKFNNCNTFLLDTLGAKPAVLNPVLVQISGSANAGLLLSQLLYWYGKGDDPDWFYKTVIEIQNETGLKRTAQETAIKTWCKLGVLEVERRGVSQKKHFHIDLVVLFDLAKKFSLKRVPFSAFRFAEICKSKSMFQQKHYTENRSHLNTKKPPQKEESFKMPNTETQAKYEQMVSGKRYRAPT